jgi:hypothetical protein
MKSTTWVLIILLSLTVRNLAAEQYGAVRKSDAGLCLSANVFDAGYMVRFDPPPNRDALTEIDVSIYEAVPLWNMKQVYHGTLKLVRQSFPGVCYLVLADEGPVEIDFRINGGDFDAELVKVNEAHPAKYADLDCNPEIIARLALGCGESP